MPTSIQTNRTLANPAAGAGSITAIEQFAQNNLSLYAQITALERFNGNPILERWVRASGSTNVVSFSTQQEAFIHQAYSALRESVYDALAVQTRLKPYLDDISLALTETGIHFDFTVLDARMNTRHGTDANAAVGDLLDLRRLRGNTLEAVEWDGLARLTDWAAMDASDAAVAATLAEFGYGGGIHTAVTATVNGSGANDVIAGQAGDDILNGNAGNDLLLGGAGDDTLNGGTGNDTLHGGAGNDRYVFNLGDGFDTVVESQGTAGTDTLAFGPGLLAGDLDIYLDADKLVFAHGNGKDKVSIANWFDSLSDSAHRLDTLTFADGKTLDLATLQLGGTGADVLIGTSANDLLVGGAGDDVLTGEAGDDLLMGGSGADQMAGGQGNDTYVVDNALDSVIELAGAGVDTVEARVSYTLSANVENLTLAGTASINAIGNELDNRLLGNSGNNALYGLDGNDTLAGGAGNDLLDGGSGADVMAGGTGSDAYVVDSLDDLVAEQAGQGSDTVYTDLSYTLGANVENLQLTGAGAVDGSGNELGNVITGNDASNTLWGLAGNDTLNGGLGGDQMLGGTGDDSYVVESAGDAVIENTGEGIDLVQSSISYTLTDKVENLTLTGTATIDATGNELNNVLTGNSGVNTLRGLAGDDTYIIDSAADTVIENAGEGTDTVQSSINYTLGANVEHLTLTGGSAINATGNELDNSLVGNYSNNVLDGGTGADSMAGGYGNDSYVLDNLGDQVSEQAGQGTDTVISPFDYQLGANVENLVLTGAAISGTGNALDNALSGTSADNTLTGLAGNDTLDGGAGADLLVGGSGDDTYVVDNLGDTAVELGNEGRDTVRASLSWTLGNHLDNLTLTGTANIDGSGNELDNVLTGNSAANTLTGLGGNDTLDGGAGADTLLGGTGNDSYVVDDIGDLVTENASEGTDLVQSSIGYTLSDNVENLTLTGSATITGQGNALDNVITGNATANTLQGLDGNDVLNGGAGADQLVGGTGNDTYIVDNSLDTVLENLDEGTDQVQASASFALADNVENLTLTGTGSINGTGNALDNIITGNSGDNLIDGGAGADQMAGGATQLASSILLANNNFYRQFTDDQVLTAEAQNLPQMQGIGWVRDLHQAKAYGHVLRARRQSAHKHALTVKKHLVFSSSEMARWV